MKKTIPSLICIPQMYMLELTASSSASFSIYHSTKENMPQSQHIYKIKRWRVKKYIYNQHVYLQSIASFFVCSPGGFIFTIAWAEYIHRGCWQSVQYTTPCRRDRWPKRNFYLFAVWVIVFVETIWGVEEHYPKSHYLYPNCLCLGFGFDLDLYLGPYLKLLQLHMQESFYRTPPMFLKSPMVNTHL